MDSRDSVGKLYFIQMRQGVVDGGEVAPDNFSAFFLISLLDRFLDMRDSLIARQNSRNREETGLHDRVDPSSHSGVACHILRIDHVELRLFLDQLLLHFTREVIPDFIRAVWGIQQKDTSGPQVFEHIQLFKKMEVVTRHQARRADQVCGPNRAGTKAQMRNGHGAGLF